MKITIEIEHGISPDLALSRVGWILSKKQGDSSKAPSNGELFSWRNENEVWARPKSRSKKYSPPLEDQIDGITVWARHRTPTGFSFRVYLADGWLLDK